VSIGKRPFFHLRKFSQYDASNLIDKGGLMDLIPGRLC